MQIGPALSSIPTIWKKFEKKANEIAEHSGKEEREKEHEERKKYKVNVREWNEIEM